MTKRTDSEPTDRVAPDADSPPESHVRWLALGSAAMILVIDQATKFWIVRAFPLNSQRAVIPGLFNITHVRNSGAAFGLFHGWNTILSVASVVTLAVLWRWRKSLHGDRRSRAIVLGVMIGGILGNLVDRIRVGEVIDFLDFYVGTHHWPVFNVADAAICVGIFLAVIMSFHGHGPVPGEGVAAHRGMD